MAIKPEGRACTIREQIVEDPASGLTFQFALVPESDAPIRLRVYGNLPSGNREILFNREGEAAATGTALTGSCRAGWLRKVKG